MLVPVGGGYMYEHNGCKKIIVIYLVDMRCDHAIKL